jgi:hypothetical protein
VAKRRYSEAAAEAAPPETVSPEARRAQRKRDRTRQSRGKKPKLPQTGWRRAIIPGATAAGVIVVAVLLIYGSGTLFQTPCLSFTASPASSGAPLFPPSNTTDFSNTWCPSASDVLQEYPLLSIVVSGGSVTLPPSIGRSTNFTNYECDLPMATHPVAPGYPAGTIYLLSPWNYNYNLSEFFGEWQDSYVSAHVNASYSTRTIDYTPAEFLGLPVNAGHSLTLFVDNQVSTAGPGLVLNTLPNLPTTYPSCMASRYGTGHTITLVYKATSTHAAHGLTGPVLGTAPPPAPTGGLFDSPNPRVTMDPGQSQRLSDLRTMSLAWMWLRPAGG